MDMKKSGVMTRLILLLELPVLSALCFGQQLPATSLEERLRRSERDAFRQVMDEKRVDLIPVLEELASKPQSGELPRIALGRLGVKKYVDEALQELLAPTNSAAYARYYREFYRDDPGMAEQTTIERACDKLGMMRDKSTVKYLVAMLDYKGDTSKFIRRGRDYVLGASPQTMAGTALWRMQLEDAPTNMPFRADESFIKAWKQWWEQNKDKYP